MKPTCLQDAGVVGWRLKAGHAALADGRRALHHGDKIPMCLQGGEVHTGAWVPTRQAARTASSSTSCSSARDSTTALHSAARSLRGLPSSPPVAKHFVHYPAHLSLASAASAAAAAASLLPLRWQARPHFVGILSAHCCNARGLHIALQAEVQGIKRRAGKLGA